MLDRIPIEILSLILDKTLRISDLKSLSLTSHAVSVVATQYLYQSITFYCSEEANFTDLIKQCDEFPIKRLNELREFAVRMPIWDFTHERCVDYRDPDMLSRVNESLEKLISYIPENTLRSFRWDTGTCLPEHILSPDGLLAKQQRNLEVLYLTTDSSCIPSDDPIVDLTSFTNLKSLTWRGLCNPVYFEALAPFLQSKECAGKLETLELDFVIWKDAERNWRHHDTKYAKFKGNFFSEHILGQGKRVLKSLRNLSLTDVSFGSAVKELIKSLNMKKLDRLKLVTCPFSLDFFQDATETYSLSLKALELVIDLDTRYPRGDEDPDIDYDQYDDTLPVMLRRCGRLEDLFILFTRLDDAEQKLYALEDLQCHLKRILLCEYDEGPKQMCLGTRAEESSWGVIIEPWNQGSLEISLWGPREGYEREKGTYCVQPSKFNCPLFYIRERGELLEYDMHRMCHVGQIMPLPELESHFRPLEYNADGSIIPTQEWSEETWCEDHEMIKKRPSYHKICPTTASNRRSRCIARRDPFNVASSYFLDYATELFSANGQPGLRVLAYGDFSLDGRWADQNVLLVRDESLKDAGGKYNFRLINDKDIAAWDLIDGNMDFLGSCPSTRILSTLTIDGDWTEDEEDEDEESEENNDDDTEDDEENGGSRKAADEAHLSGEEDEA